MRRYISCCVFWRCQHFLKLDFCVCPIRVKNGCVNKCSAHSLVCFSPPFWWLIEWNAIKFTFAAKLPSKLFARPPFKCWLALAIINANKSSHLTLKTPIGELLPVPLGSPFFFFFWLQLNFNFYWSASAGGVCAKTTTEILSMTGVRAGNTGVFANGKQEWEPGSTWMC